jgi:peptide/nickel transport system permease protein
MKLGYYVARRIIAMLIVLLGVSIITFSITRVVPSDPARLWVGSRATEQQIEQARHELGLDRPLYVQYLIYLSDLLHGDLGVSMHSRRPVVEDIRDYFPATFELTNLAMILAVAIGLPMGIVSATKRNTGTDHAVRVFSLWGVSMPVFWLGLLLQLFLSSTLHILPTTGRVDPIVGLQSPLRTITGMYTVDSLLTGNFPVFISALQHMIMPAFALSCSCVVMITRITRSSMLEVLRQDYIRTARSNGLAERTVIYKHALKNALIPTVTVAGLTYGFLLGGSVLVESIFDYPGIGLYAVGSTLLIDYPAIMGVTLLLALVYSVVNLAVDILYAFLDPRIRYG